MNQKERMLAGELYIAWDEELKKENSRARRAIRAFNSDSNEDPTKRMEIIKELFEATGEQIYIEQPFRCDYGSNISVGDYFYANFDCLILDVCKVKIGNNVMFGPRVQIYAAAHPIDLEIRNSGLEYGMPVTIKDGVWVGGNVVINPGVTIGQGSIIGSGSVVTKDIPDFVIAAGNPCRVIREITKQDQIYWQRKRQEYIEDEK